LCSLCTAVSTLYWLLVLEIFEVVLVEAPLAIAAEIRKLKMGPLGGDNGGGKWTTSWLEYGHCSGSLQAYPPLASGKAAAAQARDRNWNWEKGILCPTIGVNGAVIIMRPSLTSLVGSSPEGTH
jgi:hypothetical protein